MPAQYDETKSLYFTAPIGDVVARKTLCKVRRDMKNIEKLILLNNDASAGVNVTSSERNGIVIMSKNQDSVSKIMKISRLGYIKPCKKGLKVELPVTLEDFRKRYKELYAYIL